MNQAGDFTTKADLYRHRWDYAPAAIDTIATALDGCAGKSIADLGAGNGLLGRHFLDRGAYVYAIEPNQAMLTEAERALGHSPTFQAIRAQAEATTLPAHSMDAIVVGRALHWFTLAPARAEMVRILKPNGWLAILRVQVVDKQLQAALQAIRSAENGWNMRYGGRRPPDPPHADYFGHAAYQTLQVTHLVSESWEQFWGNLCSRSVAPNADDPAFDRFQQAAQQLFTAFSANGRLTVETCTMVSLGRMVNAYATD